MKKAIYTAMRKFKIPQSLASLLLIVSGCAILHACSEDIILGYSKEVEGVELFSAENRVLEVRNEGDEASLVFRADKTVWLAWVTSREMYPEHYSDTIYPGPYTYATGDFFHWHNVEAFLEGEVISKRLQEIAQFHRIGFLSDEFLEQSGVTLVDTRAKGTDYDRCEFTYQDWLHISLSGNGPHQLYITATALKTPGDEERRAQLVYEAEGLFISNMLTIVQPAATTE